MEEEKAEGVEEGKGRKSEGLLFLQIPDGLASNSSYFLAYFLEYKCTRHGLRNHANTTYRLTAIHILKLD